MNQAHANMSSECLYCAIVYLIPYQKTSYECRDFLSYLLAPWHDRFPLEARKQPPFAAKPSQAKQFDSLDLAKRGLWYLSF